MASSDVLVDAFERIRDAVNPAVNGLSAEQLAFRPDGESNSIGWLVWHLTRIQDDHVAGLQGGEQVWTADGWSERFALPVDPFKIDRSFVSGISDTKQAAALVHTLVQLGKVLGLETIAEGIETDDQQAWLRAENVDGGQGYLFSAPLNVEAVDSLLRDFANRPEASPAVR